MAHLESPLSRLVKDETAGDPCGPCKWVRHSLRHLQLIGNFKNAGASWCRRTDRPRFADESKVLILCDAGGANGYRVRNWKLQ